MGMLTGFSEVVIDLQLLLEHIEYRSIKSVLPHLLPSSSEFCPAGFLASRHGRFYPWVERVTLKILPKNPGQASN